jgi:hypothetical protein
MTRRPEPTYPGRRQRPGGLAKRVFDRSKPVIVQCPCGKWQIRFYFADRGVVYGTETFASKEEAATILADRLIEVGVELSKTN